MLPGAVPDWAGLCADVFNSAVEICVEKPDLIRGTPRKLGWFYRLHTEQCGLRRAKCVAFGPKAGQDGLPQSGGISPESSGKRDGFSGKKGTGS